MKDQHKHEYQGSICRTLGVFRLDCIANLPDPYKAQAAILADKFENDLYDILDGKEVEENVEKVLKPVKAVVRKKATKKKAGK